LSFHEKDKNLGEFSFCPFLQKNDCQREAKKRGIIRENQLPVVGLFPFLNKEIIKLAYNHD
jgi:hypothetical protein